MLNCKYLSNVVHLVYQTSVGNSSIEYEIIDNFEFKLVELHEMI